MNTRRVIDDSSEPVSLCVSFNEDCSNFVVGSEEGFSVFDSAACQIKIMRDLGTGIGSADMLGRTNYIALVGNGRDPKFGTEKAIIWDDTKRKIVFTLHFESSVLKVQLSRSRIVVALKNNVQIFAFSSPPKRISEHRTTENSRGLCCLAEDIAAFPGRTIGQVQLAEPKSGGVSILPAHSTSLSALALSSDGEILATASETGTLIRVFSTHNRARIAEFRRGIDTANIFSISISPLKTLLAVTSDKSTLHIFSLAPVRHAASSAHGISYQGTPKFGALASEANSLEHKWGLFSKIPFLPRLFSDSYSLASAHFEMGRIERQKNDIISGGEVLAQGHSATSPDRGVIGWLDEETVAVISAGLGGRWEIFTLNSDEVGKIQCCRSGWKRYMEQ